jgi:cytochrome c553
MSHPLIAALLGTALAFGSASVAAQPKPPADKAPKVEEKKPATTDKGLGMENAHAMCIGCHGIPGYKTAFPSVYHVPKIAGQQPAYLFNALKAYQSGERSHPSMRGIAGGLSEEVMKELAEYYGGGK